VIGHVRMSTDRQNATEGKVDDAVVVGHDGTRLDDDHIEESAVKRMKRAIDGDSIDSVKVCGTLDYRACRHRSYTSPRCRNYSRNDIHSNKSSRNSSMTVVTM